MTPPTNTASYHAVNPPYLPLSDFIGTGNASLPVTAVGTFSASGAGNLFTQVMTEANATACVAYTYLLPTPTVTPTVTSTATVTSTVTVTPTRTPVPAMLQIGKTAAVDIAPGAPLAYTLKYRNVGGSTATNVIITETVPGHTTFDAAASTPGWSCPDGSPPGTSCTLSVPDVPPGAERSASFVVTVDPSASPGAIRNTVLIGAGEGSGGSGSTGTIVTGPNAAPALSPWGWRPASPCSSALPGTGTGNDDKALVLIERTRPKDHLRDEQVVTPKARSPS